MAIGPEHKSPQGLVRSILCYFGLHGLNFKIQQEAINVLGLAEIINIHNDDLQSKKARKAYILKGLPMYVAEFFFKSDA